MLGDGVYETTTLEKTLNYVKPNEAEGIVFKLKASLGKCYQVRKMYFAHSMKPELRNSQHHDKERQR